ncbi:hypothetical protein LEP1GSC137_3977 [Leptospira borgpetersenii str. Noumea 25]|nr:hypothetical protein LEP1GSC137_3977 [Leptospira borgpetersenii str. Noumea 25]
MNAKRNRIQVFQPKAVFGSTLRSNIFSFLSKNKMDLQFASP